MLKLIFFTALVIFTAEALVMLFLESFGAEFEWEGQPATVLFCSYREDFSVQRPQAVHLNG